MNQDKIKFIIEAHPIYLHDRDGTEDIVGFIKNRLRYRFPNSSINLIEIPLQVIKDRGSIIVEISTLSPLLDLDLITCAVKIASEQKCEVTIEGAIPGTVPTRIYYDGASSKKKHCLLWKTQRDYNTQLSLNKLKRIKIFFHFLKTYHNLVFTPISQFLEYLGTRDGVRSVLSYGTRVELIDLTECPICGCKRIYPLHHDIGQPIIGFLTKHSVYYFMCGDCGLVFLNPTIQQDDLKYLYDWYDSEGKAEPTEKLYSIDALERHASIANFQVFIDKYAPKMQFNSKLIDLGGGHGEFAVMVKESYPEWDVTMMDFKASDVKEFLDQREVLCHGGDFINFSLGDEEYDVITMWEVLEHLSIDILKEIWSKVFNALKSGGYFALSTPDFLSSYTHSQDFWAIFAPQHLTVLSEPILKSLWKEAGFELVEVDRTFSMFRQTATYFSYGAKNNASIGARGDAAILDDILHNKSFLLDQKAWMLEKKHGAELILLLRKPN